MIYDNTGKRYIDEQLHWEPFVHFVVDTARHHAVTHYSSLNGRRRMHTPGSYRPHPSSIFLYVVGYRDCRTPCYILYQCDRSLSCAGQTIHQDFVEMLQVYHSITDWDIVHSNLSQLLARTDDDKFGFGVVDEKSVWCHPVTNIGNTLLNSINCILLVK